MRGARLSASLLVLALLQAASAPAAARLLAPEAANAHCRCSVPMECCKRGFCPAERSARTVMASCDASTAEAPPPVVELLAIPVHVATVLPAPANERTEFEMVLRRDGPSPCPGTPPPRDRG